MGRIRNGSQGEQEGWTARIPWADVTLPCVTLTAVRLSVPLGPRRPGLARGGTPPPPAPTPHGHPPPRLPSLTRPLRDPPVPRGLEKDLACSLCFQALLPGRNSRICFGAACADGADHMLAWPQAPLWPSPILSFVCVCVILWRPALPPPGRPTSHGAPWVFSSRNDGSDPCKYLTQRNRSAPPGTPRRGSDPRAGLLCLGHGSVSGGQ